MVRTGRRILVLAVVSVVALAFAPAPAHAEPDFTPRNLWNARSNWHLNSYAPTANQVVTMSPGSGTTQSIWLFWSVDNTAANDYTLRPWDNTSLCLDQHYSTSGPTNLLRAWDCTGVQNQTWVISFYGPGNVIRNARSGWCLDQSHSNNNTTPTSTVVAAPCHYISNQQWFNN